MTARRTAPRRDRLRTLYVEANGFDRDMYLTDTLLRGVFGYRDGARPPRFARRFPRVVEMFDRLVNVYGRLGYGMDWKDAFVASPDLDVEVCNMTNFVEYGRALLRIGRYDLVVISHLAAGDDMSLLLKTMHAYDRRRCPLAVFVGNEYDLLDQKIDFIKQTGAEYVCTQLPLEAGRYLYAEAAGARVLPMPHALNPAVYHPDPSVPRTTDVGFIGDIYWPFVGDRERTDLIEYFRENAASLGLTSDIRTVRLTRAEWADFLRTTHGVIGAESGTYYLNDRGRLLERARTYNLHQNRSATFEDVFERFYAGVPRGVSGKSVSSRHFEPMGTKTCQILLEGEYNGVLRPDEHYIPVRRDLSDVGEAVRKFRDAAYRTEIAERAHEHAMSEHTYDHRVAALVRVVTEASESTASPIESCVASPVS
jgi:hypothetical protein